jgi:uncharacterized protein (DUF924 family)
MTITTAAEVVQFWRDAGPRCWFTKDAALDHVIRERFLVTHEAASRGEYDAWEQSPEGALALMILLDQFPRNIFRGSPHAFATDPLARVAAGRALARGFDTATDAVMRQFFYLPFMHSEALDDQNRCVRIYEGFGNAEQLQYARQHRDIIARFGRFPHRNRQMGRDTTPAEREFLDQGGFAG